MKFKKFKKMDSQKKQLLMLLCNNSNILICCYCRCYCYLIVIHCGIFFYSACQQTMHTFIGNLFGFMPQIILVIIKSKPTNDRSTVT